MILNVWDTVPKNQPNLFWTVLTTHYRFSKLLSVEWLNPLITDYYQSSFFCEILIDFETKQKTWQVESMFKRTETCSCRPGGHPFFPSGQRASLGFLWEPQICSHWNLRRGKNKWEYDQLDSVWWCDVGINSPAAMQWKPTVREVVFTGKQPGRQRITGSMEKHLDSWPLTTTCFSSSTDLSLIRHSANGKRQSMRFFVAWGACWHIRAALCSPPLRLTAVVPATLSRQNPGMSKGDRVLGQVPAGHTELLFDLPVSLSAESTSLSLHPVHNFNL